MIFRLLLCCALASLAGCDGEQTTDAPPEAPASSSETAAPLFEEIAARTGLDFFHVNGATGAFHMPEIMGAGAALLDFDGDGDLDIYLLQGTAFDDTQAPPLRPAPAQQAPGNRLFRNELVGEGALRFTDVTDSAGVGDTAYGMGAAVGDIDNDGDPDLYVTNLGANRLYRNNGDGSFSDIAAQTPLAGNDWSTSAAFVDFDLDGDLDLYVVDYVVFAADKAPHCESIGGNQDYCGPQNFTADADHLYRNDGEGRFVDVSETLGIASVAGPGLGVTSADFDMDGWPDLFVANDGTANYAWRNLDGKGFEERGLMSGTAFNLDGSPEASMGVTAGDFDGDGDPDLFMTHLVNETNTLYVNDGSAVFIDATDRFGLGFGSRARTGFGAGWFDYDNDGWLDLYIANGDVKLEERSSDESNYPFEQPNQLYRNLQGRRFEEIDAGLATTLNSISRGVAFGDIDNDGRSDFVLVDNAGPVRLFRNLGEADNWLRVKLTGVTSNRDGYGARLALLLPGQVPRWRRIHSDGSYLSANDPRLTLGLPADTGRVSLGVVWPSGKRERWDALAVAETHLLEEGAGLVWPDE